jgi:hypothetical protein
VIICHGTRRSKCRTRVLHHRSEARCVAVPFENLSRESTQCRIPKITSPTPYIQYRRVSKRRAPPVSPRNTTNQGGLPIPRQPLNPHRRRIHQVEDAQLCPPLLSMHLLFEVKPRGVSERSRGEGALPNGRFAPAVFSHDHRTTIHGSRKRALVRWGAWEATVGGADGRLRKVRDGESLFGIGQLGEGHSC